MITCILMNFYPLCKNEISFLSIEINIPNNPPKYGYASLNDGDTF